METPKFSQSCSKEPLPEDLQPGGGVAYYQFEDPRSTILQTFPAPVPGSQNITFVTHEVTALCPLTGQPDFYTVEVTYVPDENCIESKSAKMYFGAYRNYAGFIETLVAKVLRDWVEACSAQYTRVTLTMVPRGGIEIKVIQEEYNTH